jgi:hypothetical protein
MLLLQLLLAVPACMRPMRHAMLPRAAIEGMPYAHHPNASLHPLLDHHKIAKQWQKSNALHPHEKGASLQ